MYGQSNSLHFSVFLLILFVVLIHSFAVAQDEPAEIREGVLWEPYLEWSIHFSGYGDTNPFDIEAEATFLHESTGDGHTTGLFYDGGGVWKFRFTGTHVGKWEFETKSQEPYLDGYRGTLNIRANPNPAARGFITSHGDRFVRQGPGEDDIEGFIPNVWMNYRRWGNPDMHGWTDIASTFTHDVMVTAFLDDAQDHGCNGIQAIFGNQWFTKDVAAWDQIDNENPDIASFEAIEEAILQAHSRGMFIHIWAWGDEQRRWTPRGLTGGINGEADRRFQRYLAARLGPLPGWTMSYGFDLNEWVSADDVSDWVSFLEVQMGWPRVLGARQAGRFVPSENTTYLSHDARPEGAFYDTALELLDEADGRPVWFERRFSWMRDDFWTMENTRRALWQFAMAGGAGSIWGHYPLDSHEQRSSSYETEPMRTYRDFWRGRFIADMERDNERIEQAWVLRSGSDRLIFYQERTETISMDLSNLTKTQPAIAVDANAPYTEIHIGPFEPMEQHWTAPYQSDWAIAVGEFFMK